MLLVPLLVLYVIKRRSVEGHVMRRIMSGKQDAASALKLRERHAAMQARERAIREKMWLKAQKSARAAHRLGQRIRDDVNDQELLRSELAALADGGEALRVLDAERVDAERQLTRLDALHPHRTTGHWQWHSSMRRHSTPTPVRWIAMIVIGTAATGAYVFVFVLFANALHLEPEAGFQIAGGVLCLVAGLLGLSPWLHDSWEANPLAVYVLTIGVLLAALGTWRQVAIVRGRAECARVLAAEPDVHRRLRLMETHKVSGIPSMDSGIITSLSCRQLP